MPPIKGNSLDASTSPRRPIPRSATTHDVRVTLKPHFLRPSLLRVGSLLAGFLAGEFLTAAAATVSTTEAPGFQWTAFFGPFHMVVLHFPIGFLTVAAVLEAWHWWRRAPWARQANTVVLPLAALSAVIAAALGWMRAGAGEFDPHLLNLHRWSGVGLAILTLLTALLLPRPDRGTPSPRHVLRFHIAFGGALALLGVAGHFGGSLTHGSGFLTRSAPSFVRKVLGETSSSSGTPVAKAAPTGAPTVGTGPAATGESAYRTIIQPALQQRCYSCHGPEKQKGKLRLDRRENALVGGESGEPAIQPGDVRKSRLLYHLLVPREHDDAMPPDGKEPLTPEQILAISRWIQQGAPFE